MTALASVIDSTERKSLHASSVDDLLQEIICQILSSLSDEVPVQLGQEAFPAINQPSRHVGRILHYMLMNIITRRSRIAAAARSAFLVGC